MKNHTTDSTANSFSAQYRDPRWQRKRLEILERDSHTCRRCGKTTGTLQVHHMSYVKNRDAWDYSDHNFVTLCFDCHEEIHSMKDMIMTMLNSFMRASCNNNNEDLVVGLGFLESVMAGVLPPSKSTEASHALILKNIIGGLSELAASSYYDGKYSEDE